MGPINKKEGEGKEKRIEREREKGEIEGKKKKEEREIEKETELFSAFPLLILLSLLPLSSSSSSSSLSPSSSQLWVFQRRKYWGVRRRREGEGGVAEGLTNCEDVVLSHFVTLVGKGKERKKGKKREDKSEILHIDEEEKEGNM